MQALCVAMCRRAAFLTEAVDPTVLLCVTDGSWSMQVVVFKRDVSLAGRLPK